MKTLIAWNSTPRNSYCLSTNYETNLWQCQPELATGCDCYMASEISSQCLDLSSCRHLFETTCTCTKHSHTEQFLTVVQHVHFHDQWLTMILEFTMLSCDKKSIIFNDVHSSVLKLRNNQDNTNG